MPEIPSEPAPLCGRVVTVTVQQNKVGEGSLGRWAGDRLGASLPSGHVCLSLLLLAKVSTVKPLMATPEVLSPAGETPPTSPLLVVVFFSGVGWWCLFCCLDSEHCL